jgi:hypothetical protein
VDETRHRHRNAAFAGGAGDEREILLLPRVRARFRRTPARFLLLSFPKIFPCPKISAASSEIPAEKPVNIARTHRKIAVPNRIALIRVRQSKSFPSCGFAKDRPPNSRRSPTRNVDASDSHRGIGFESDLNRDVYSVFTRPRARIHREAVARSETELKSRDRATFATSDRRWKELFPVGETVGTRSEYPRRAA